MGVSIGGTALPLLIAVSIGVAVAACGDESTPPEGELRPTLTLIPELETPRPTTLVDAPVGSPPILDAELVRLSEEVVFNDPIVSRLANGSHVAIASTGGRYAGGRDPETGKELLVGTVVRATLSPPISHERIELPSTLRRSDYYALWPDELQARYDYSRHGTTTYHLEGVSTFRAEVDIYSQEVIGIGFEGTPRDQVVEVIDASFDFASRFDISITQGGPDLAREIVDRDEYLANLLNSADYVMVSSIQQGENRISFGIVQARWDGSVTVVAGEYPVFIDRDYETLDYRSVIVSLNKTNTGVLTIHVDLDREEIISVEPRRGD